MGTALWPTAIWPSAQTTPSPPQATVDLPMATRSSRLRLAMVLKPFGSDLNQNRSGLGRYSVFERSGYRFA
jgi:hypothetical protein